MSKEFGEKIREIRYKNKLTQTELAFALGYSDKSMIAHIENGDNEMSNDKISLLIDKYNIDANELFKKKENKNELIHIRIEPTVKEKSEDIFRKFGINMSYAVSLFLNQVIIRDGLPFTELPQTNETEIEKLTKMIESTGGNGEVSEKNQKIIHLYSIGDIDYETAVYAIKRNANKVDE